MAREGVGERVFERENRCYRDGGRALSAARDAAVLVKMFDEMRPKLHGLTAPETIANIHDRLQAVVDVNVAKLDLSKAILELQAARERLEGWPWLHKEDAWRVPGLGLRCVHRKGRRAMRRVSADDSAAEDFHAWRKQVKLLASQLRLLCPIHPDKLKTAAKQLDQIAEWLTVMLQEVVRTGEVCQDGGGCIPNRPPSPTAPMHANATLTPLRRAQMTAELATTGASLRTIAARYGVCEKTVRRWRLRAQQLGSPWHLPDRSSAPGISPPVPVTW